MKPILYDYEIEPRFSDIDSYGHVNSKNYMDYVSTSRLYYMENVMGLSVEETFRQGLGFYLAGIEQKFIRPINGMVKVRIQSFIKEWQASRVLVDYKICSPDLEKTYSVGEIKYVCVDLKTQKPIDFPESIKKYFFE